MDHPHTLQRLSDTYGVDEADLWVLASTLTDYPDGEDVSIEIGIELRKILSPDGERLHLFSYDETNPI